jgi:hypothetical protein
VRYYDITGEPLPKDHYQCSNCHGVFHEEGFDEIELAMDGDLCPECSVLFDPPPSEDSNFG